MYNRNVEKLLKEDDSNVIDPNYYKEEYGKYEQRRNKALETCNHNKWHKVCSTCKHITGSEITDNAECELREIKKQYNYLLDKYIIEMIMKRYEPTT